MPRAEVGSTKYIANQMKAKGLQRLRWYCQACQRQMRDENGFKCHVASESHVRQMQLIGEDPRKAIRDFSNQFLKDFIQLLRTGHGEKKVNVNHFYQEYISNKEHIHMNATRWNSLTEFAKYLGREGICRVDEDEKNEARGGASALMISWIDNSPEALRRQVAIRKKERQDRGDEEREQRMIQEQIRRAKGQSMVEDDAEDDEVLPSDGAQTETDGHGIKRKDGEKIVLNFGAKKAMPGVAPVASPTPPLSEKDDSSSEKEKEREKQDEDAAPPPTQIPSATTPPETADTASTQPPAKQPPVSLSFGSMASKPKNVFAAASKKNPLNGTKKPVALNAQRPMSEAERIMKEEIERKRQRESNGFKGGNVFKKQRVS
jgi:DNA/RNA-binding protein KIN17